MKSPAISLPFRTPRSRALRFLLVLALAFSALDGSAGKLLAQGCVSARFMALGVGPDGARQLPPGEWELGVSFRYLYADEGWRGSDRWPAYEQLVGNRITVISSDVQATYAFNPRLSATLTAPFVYGQTSNPAEHSGVRHVVKASGLGDIRLVGNAWLFDPPSHESGNIFLGLGIKLPTGDEAATDVFHRSTGDEVRPVDISIQPGDGGWGAIMEMAGYRRLVRGITGYLDGYYLINPREKNRAYTTGPVYGAIRNLSVPDQYQARAGLAWTPWPMRGPTVAFGGRVTGIPPRDLVGGSEGFRRPGFVIYVEPGLSWSTRRFAFEFSVPLRVDANRQNNIYDDRNNAPAGGAFARSLVVTRFAWRF